MTVTPSNLKRLEDRLAQNWTHLHSARELALAKRAEMKEALAGEDSDDTSIIVSGSLARDEFTEGSDIDWTLLIDGAADPKHFQAARQIKAIVDKLALKSTGPEGTFSAMVFSHDLIHDIGGEDDTNRNTTRRLLLLLESCAIGRDEAHQRVVKNILNRYLLEDRGFWKGSQFHVPRFLQNDFARYWRTVAVDFAYKLRARASEGWAIRNIKLRMSRKLIYVSGLLACYRCHFDHNEVDWKAIAESPDAQKQIIDYFVSVFRETPLEIIAGVLLRFPHLNAGAVQILGSYNEFLGLLGNETERIHLEKLTEQAAETDAVYQRARRLCHEFRDGLLTFFFDRNSGMEDLTRNYGVF